MSALQCHDIHIGISVSVLGEMISEGGLSYVHTEKCTVPLTCIHVISNWSSFWKIANKKIHLDLQGYMLNQHNRILSRTVANTGITFVGLETIQKDVHFGGYQIHFSVCTVISPLNQFAVYLCFMSIYWVSCYLCLYAGSLS